MTLSEHSRVPGVVRSCAGGFTNPLVMFQFQFCEVDRSILIFVWGNWTFREVN